METAVSWVRVAAERRRRAGDSAAGADLRGFRPEDSVLVFVLTLLVLPVFFFDGFFRAELVAAGASKSEAWDERARTVLDRVAIVVVIPQPFPNGRHSTARHAA